MIVEEGRVGAYSGWVCKAKGENTSGEWSPKQIRLPESNLI